MNRPPRSASNRSYTISPSGTTTSSGNGAFQTTRALVGVTSETCGVRLREKSSIKACRRASSACSLSPCTEAAADEPSPCTEASADEASPSSDHAPEEVVPALVAPPAGLGPLLDPLLGALLPLLAPPLPPLLVPLTPLLLPARPFTSFRGDNDGVLAPEFASAFKCATPLFLLVCFRSSFCLSLEYCRWVLSSFW